jgi:2-C-methyl-D-erythritol 4-phosphate cytidylyltransferase
MPEVSDLVLVLGPHTIERGMQLVATLGLPTIAVCVGGDTRAESVRRGIEALDEDITLVAVHDAARPLATRDLTRRVLAAARETGAAVPVIPVADTIHVPDDGGRIAQVLDRSRMRAAQTPQIARRDWLEAAYARADGRTDEGGLLFAAGYPVALVDGDPDNLKITWPRDLAIAEALLAEREREG